MNINKSIMKKILNVFFVCMLVVLTSCNFNTTSYTNVDAVNTVVDLSNTDYEIIGTVEGNSKQVYVLGIGGLSERSLIDNAKADMYRNAKLKDGEAIIYPSTTTSVSFYLVVEIVRAKATGYKIRMYKDSRSKVDLKEEKTVTEQTLETTQESTDTSLNNDVELLSISVNDSCSFNMVKVSDFYIGQTEVTENLWNSVMKNKTGKKDISINNISVGEINEFCNKLNTMTQSSVPEDYEFCIPTEEQWVLAAKGGKYSSKLEYAGSAEINKVAWYGFNTENGYKVATKAPNELSIYDMCGGVSEICLNSYAKSKNKYMTHGGSIYDGKQSCKISSWQVFYDEVKSKKVGFRLALVKK